MSCITSVDGIRFWLCIDLIGPQAFGYFFNLVLLWDNFDGEVFLEKSAVKDGDDL